MRQYFFIFFFIFPLILAAQNKRLLDDPISTKLVEKITLDMYNFNFGNSDQDLRIITERLPGHPVNSFLKAITLYWEKIPITSDKELFAKFQGYINETISISEKRLEENANDVEAIFFALSGYSLLAQYSAEDGNYLRALKEAKKAYNYMKKGFTLTDEYPEFYFTTGLYNYYREQYPESHPVYKPFVWVFASGNKELGLKQLNEATQKATFTKMEAMVYSAHINLRYEGEPEKALVYTNKLVSMFPNNLFYHTLYTENLMVLENYKGTYPSVEKLLASDNSFFKMAGQIFRGMIHEKERKEYRAAKAYYLKALQTGYNLEKKSNNTKSFAYMGLGRIYEIEGDKEKARYYFEKALDHAQYDAVKKEAKEYLARSK
jgi:tetratricopeptide (TPR) repeat protein